MPCDLHCHSRISDGSLGINEILSLARRRGLTAVSITDHDAVVGSTRAAVLGKRLGITVINGIEMSCIDPQRKRKVHILGYLYDHPDRLEGACHRMMQSRRDAAIQMLRKVLRYYPITPELVTQCASGSATVYKQHIMHALIEAGFTDKFFGDVFQKLFSSHGGVAYVPIEYPDVRSMIDLIHSAGGVAVLAHPYAYDSMDLMQELVAEGRLDGIEVWHPKNSEEQSIALSNFAQQHGLVMTGGTDFHGMYTDTPHPLGYRTAPDSVLADLEAAKLKRHSTRR